MASHEPGPPGRGRRREPVPIADARGGPRLARFLVGIGLAAVMAFLALRPSPYLEYIGWMPRGLGVWADRHGVLRNTAAFFGCSVMVLALFGPRLWLVAALCAFGTGLEVAQLWIPGRIFDWKDIVATVTGVLLAWPVAWVLVRRRGVP